jgi:hypothetical protein
MRAEVAFLNRAQILVQIKRIIGARLHARATPDAGVAVDVYDPIRPLAEGVDWADRHTRSIGAMVTPLDQKVTFNPRKLADFDVLDVRPKPADRHIVLGFAGDRTGMASDTGFLIDDEPVLHRRILL